MKTTFTLRVSCLVALLLASLNDADAQGDKIIKLPIADSTRQLSWCPSQPIDPSNSEREINLGKFIKNKSGSEEQLQKFAECVRVNASLDQIADSPEIINMGDFMRTLYDPSVRAQKADDSCASKMCLGAVRIILALHNDTIKYYYSPGYLRINKNKRKKTRTKRFIGEKIYEYKNGFRIAADTSAFCSAYRENIRIKHRDNENFEPYRPTRDGIWHGDSRFSTFTFQEIIRFYNDEHKSSSEFYCDSLIIFNGAAKYYYKTKKNLITKHTILMKVTVPFSNQSRESLTLHKKNDQSPITTTVSNNSLTVQSKNSDSSANLAHLCPPSCSQLQYKIE